MTQNTIVMVAATAVTVAALVGVFLYSRDVSREIRIGRKEISRFPLFAARDHLVRLVADGEIGDDDAAWRRTYQSACALLSMHQQLHLHDVVKRYILFSSMVSSNPALRHHYRRIQVELLKAQKRSPSFGQVLREIEAAFASMVAMRTGFRERVELKIMLWRLVLPPPFRLRQIVVQMPVARPRFSSDKPLEVEDTSSRQTETVIRRARRSMRQPTAATIAAFAESQRIAC